MDIKKLLKPLWFLFWSIPKKTNKRIVVKKELEKTIKEILKPLGFKKKNLNWYYFGGELIIRINFQKSNWSHGFYINLEIYEKKLNETDFPCTYSWFHWRLESIFKDDKNLREFYDFDDLNPSESRKLIFLIWEIIKKYSHIFMSMTNVVFLKNFISKNKFHHLLGGTMKAKLWL